jgi:hypothetical protein
MREEQKDNPQDTPWLVFVTSIAVHGAYQDFNKFFCAYREEHGKGRLVGGQYVAPHYIYKLAEEIIDMAALKSYSNAARVANLKESIKCLVGYCRGYVKVLPGHHKQDWIEKYEPKSTKLTLRQGKDLADAIENSISRVSKYEQYENAEQNKCRLIVYFLDEAHFCEYANSEFQ